MGLREGGGKGKLIWVGEWLSRGGCGGVWGAGRCNFKHISSMFTFHGSHIFQIPLCVTDCVPHPTRVIGWLCRIVVFSHAAPRTSKPARI